MIQPNARVRHARILRPAFDGAASAIDGEVSWRAWLKTLSLATSGHPPPDGTWMYRTQSPRLPLGERLPA